MNNYAKLRDAKALYEQPVRGKLLEMEWSSKKIMAEHTVSMVLGKANNSIEMTIGDRKIYSDVIVTDHKIVPKNLVFSLPALIKGHTKGDTYTYKIKEIEVFKDASQNIYLYKISTWIQELNEPGHPMYIQEMEQLLQGGVVSSSIGIYPNPFKDRFKIYFTLEQPAEVILEMYDLNGVRKIKPNAKTFTAGDNSIAVDTRHLLEGIYISKLTVNGISHVKQVVKINETK